jgi:enoyl-CoA hydratase/carnithine racemase
MRCTRGWPDDARTDLARLVRELATPDAGPAPLEQVRPAIDRHFAHADVAQVIESLEHEVHPEYAAWAAETVRLLRTRSPTMLSVTLRQLQLGRSMTLAACFRMELGMAEASFGIGEFREGVRAVLIDKDNAPRWQPARIEDVSPESVAAFFRDPWANSPHPLAGLEEDYGA